MSKQLVVGYLAYDTVYSKPMIFCWTLGGLVGKILGNDDFAHRIDWRIESGWAGLSLVEYA